MQHGAPDPPAGAAGEPRLDPVAAVEVADAVEGQSWRIHSQVGEPGDRGRHQPLAAGLVDVVGRGSRTTYLEPGAARVERGGETDRPTAGDDEVDHPDRLRRAALSVIAGSVASAAFSARMRTASRGMFSTVKARAVTQAKPTMGSAKPSMTTAT